MRMSDSMADTTNDIWNDDDGVEEAGKKPRRLRRFLLAFLILASVLGIVLLAAWRDGTGFDALYRRFAYGGAQTEATAVFHYDAAASNRFAALGEGLAVLSDTSLKVLGKDGGEVWSTPVKMKAPALLTGGGCAVAYDVGGTELYVVGPEGERLTLTTTEEEPFLAATLNDSGWLAVTARKKNYKGCVSVYNEKMAEVFAFESSQRFVMDAYVLDDNDYLAAVTLGQENSVFVSNVVLYDMTQEGQAPNANYSVADGLVLSIGQQDSHLVTVSDTALTFAGKDGQVEATYAYPDAFLREYDCGGDGFTALLLNRYQSGSVGRLVTVGPDGTEIAALDVHEEISAISAAGRYLAVLYIDRLVIYNQELQVYATLEDTESAKSVLVRSDGSALLLSSERAQIVLP